MTFIYVSIYCKILWDKKTSLLLKVSSRMEAFPVERSGAETLKGEET
jgi:hypothetical protein